MNITKSNKALWASLFVAAEKFNALEPWEWIHDSQIFGVQNPETGKIGWCCIMGAAGQVFGMMVYEDAAGFHSYQRIIHAGMNEYPLTDQIETALNQVGQKIEFVPADELSEEDNAAYRALGKQFTEEENIQFRSFAAGQFPWFLSDEQVPFMTLCIEQAIEGAKILKKNPDLLFGLKENFRLVRMKKLNKDFILEWTNSYLPQPELEEKVAEINPFLLNRVKKLPRKKQNMVLSHTYTKDPIFEEAQNPCPYFPKLSIWAEEESGMVVKHNLYQQEDNNNTVVNIIKDLEEIGYLPETVSVNSAMLEEALRPLFTALDIELEFYEEIELLDNIMEGMNGEVDDEMMDQLQYMMQQNPDAVAEMLEQMNMPKEDFEKFLEMMRQMREN